MIGSDPSDIPSMKRWLAFLEGGLLPIISLTSLHFFVKYEKVNSSKEEDNQVTPQVTPQVPPKYPSTDEVNRVWDTVKNLKEEGKLLEWTEEEIKDEPTALANSQYRNEENLDVDDDIIESYMFPNTEEIIEKTENDGVRRLTYTKPS